MPIQTDDPITAVASAIGAAQTDPSRQPSKFGRLGLVARRVVFRLLRPYTSRQVTIDNAILDALTDLERRLCHIEDLLSRSTLEEPHWLTQQRRDEESMRQIITNLPHTANCIDIGAHKGEVLAQMVQAAPQGQHIAYEPLPHLHSDLAARYPQVEVRRAALSNRSGSATFLHVRDAEGWSGLRYRPLPDGMVTDIAEIPVQLEVLDDVLSPDYAPVLIKIDVEGAEQQVLEGALRTLKDHKPLVIFEHGYGAADAYGTTPDHIYDIFINKAGMKISRLEGGQPYSLSEFQATFYSSERVNFLAHP
jgi:FkbM family methyltransferase